MPDPTREEALAHFGVKGMRWGHRKAAESTGITRKQNRQMNREASEKFYADKATTLYKEAKKGGDSVLIETRLPFDSVKTVVTGRQFVEQLERGGALDIRVSEVFARQPSPDSQYVRNTDRIGTYRKQNFRKK